MTDEQDQGHDHETRAAQRETPSEREAEHNQANRQDLNKAPEGRDQPPAKTVTRGKRTRNSPWLGGG